MSETLWLQPSAQAPSRARRWLSGWCSNWGCADLSDDAALLLSELITNATLHARTTITVSARFSAHELKVAVADRQPGHPEGTMPGQTAEGGRGLPIVAALADRWGVHSHRGGKVVWFVLRSVADRNDDAPVLALQG